MNAAFSCWKRYGLNFGPGSPASADPADTFVLLHESDLCDHSLSLPSELALGFASDTLSLLPQIGQISRSAAKYARQ